MRYINETQIRTLFPERPKDCHKGNFGYVALIGGSIEYSGAIRLAAHANSAMRSGAGIASVAAPRGICPLIAPQILEATLFPLSDNDGELLFNEEEFASLCRRYDCITFGMGVGFSAETRKAAEYLLTHFDRTLIIDADGLNAMSELDHELIRSSKARLVLTPHLKEFSRLSGLSIAEAKKDPEAAAAYLAEELDAVVLLKGSTTVVAGKAVSDGECSETARSSGQLHSDIRILAADRGCPGMATAGSGDVLSGILSALCVNADDLVLAAAAGAYINGTAGELAQSRRSDVTMTAADTAMCVADVIDTILEYRK